RGATDKALSLLERAAKADATNADSRTNLAAIYRARGELDKALRFVREALMLDVKNAGAYVTLGLLHQAQKRHHLALFVFSKAIELAAKNADAYNARGISYLATRDIKAAAKDLAEALRLRPAFTAARFNLAALYLRFHQWKRASDEYKKLVEGDARSL